MRNKLLLLITILAMSSILFGNSTIEPQFRIACHEDSWIKKVENTTAKIIATSEMESNGKYSYKVKNLIDGNKETCWVPKVVGNDNGIFEFVILKIPYGSKGIKITNGLAMNKRLYYANNRVKKLYIGFINKVDPLGHGACPNKREFSLTYQTTINNIVHLKDSFEPQSIYFSTVIHKFNWHDKYFFKYKKDVYLVIAIWDIYKGRKYNDTCVSEVEVIK